MNRMLRRTILFIVTCLMSILCSASFVMAEQYYTTHWEEECDENGSVSETGYIVPWTAADEKDCEYEDTESHQWVTGAPHKWGDWYISYEPDDCSDKAMMERDCMCCPKEQYYYFQMYPHKWGKWKIYRKSTAYVKGEKYRICHFCENEDSKTLPLRKITKNEKKARKVVNKYMKAAKNYKVKKMNSCFAKKPKTYGYPTAKIDWVFKKHNKKIKWEILNIKPKGKRIDVKVRVTRPDLYSREFNAMYDALVWAWDKWGTNAQYHGKETGLKALHKFNKRAKKGKIKTKTQTVTFKMIKTSKGWKIQKKTRTIVDIATGYIYKAMDDATDEWLKDEFD